MGSVPFTLSLVQDIAHMLWHGALLPFGVTKITVAAISTIHTTITLVFGAFVADCAVVASYIWLFWLTLWATVIL